MEDSSLISFMRSRGIEDSIIKYFQQENIDVTAVLAMGEDELIKFIPKYGDRIAIIDFCKIQSGPKKHSIIEKIKEKILEKQKKDKSSSNDRPKTVKRSSSAIAKQKRFIELGWLCCGPGCGSKNKMVQIRTKQGGGTRKVCMLQSSTMEEVEKMAKQLFFPNDVSPKGRLLEFDTSLLDFKHNAVDKNWTIQHLYHLTKMTRLRFYLATVKKHADKDCKKIKKRLKHNKEDSDNEEDHIGDNKPLTNHHKSKYVLSSDDEDQESFATEQSSEIRKIDLNTTTRPHASSQNPAADYLFSFVVNENLESYLTDDIVSQPGTSSATSSRVSAFTNGNSYCEGNTMLPIFESEDLGDLVGDLVGDQVHVTLEADEDKEKIVANSFVDELKALQNKVSQNKTTCINIIREDVFGCVDRAFSRKSFSPFQKIDVLFVGEGAVDNGGPKREMWRLLLDQLRQSSLFEGSEYSKNINFILKEYQNKKYYCAGQMIAMSIVHDGPGPKFLSKVLVNCLVQGIMTKKIKFSLEDVGNTETYLELKKVAAAQTLEEFKKSVDDSEYLQKLGVPIIVALDQKEKILEGAIEYYLIHLKREAMEQFFEGLNTCNIYDLLRKYPEEAEQLLCNTGNDLTTKIINDLFEVVFSEDGTQRKVIEKRIVAYWKDYVQLCEDGECKTTLQDILIFVTAAKEIPPLGFSEIPTIQFLHEEDTKYPKANTCSLILFLPVVELNFNAFVENMDFGIINGGCTFGFA